IEVVPTPLPMMYRLLSVIGCASAILLSAITISPRFLLSSIVTDCDSGMNTLCTVTLVTSILRSAAQTAADQTSAISARNFQTGPNPFRTNAIPAPLPARRSTEAIPYRFGWHLTSPAARRTPDDRGRGTRLRMPMRAARAQHTSLLLLQL